LDMEQYFGQPIALANVNRRRPVFPKPRRRWRHRPGPRIPAGHFSIAPDGYLGTYRIITRANKS